MKVYPVERLELGGLRDEPGFHWSKPGVKLVSADIIILAVSVSVRIGLFFGFYPTWHSSRLNPIDALRSG